MSTILRPSLPAFALFGGMLSVAGLPIYIFAPTFYAENYGVGLTAIAAVLFWLRLIDAVQDPLFGWLSERLDKNRSRLVVLGVLVLILSMILLFAVPPKFTPLVWFAICYDDALQLF